MSKRVGCYCTAYWMCSVCRAATLSKLRRIAVLIYATIVATQLGYRVTFTARDNNSQVLVFKNCLKDGKLVWFAAQGAYVEGTQTEVELRFNSDRGIPAGAKCNILGEVFAYQVPGNTDAGGNPDPEYVAETTEYLEEQH